MAIENRICFEVLSKESENLFYYTSQEISKIKLLNINIIQSKYNIIIDQTDHIMKKTIQEYWGTKIKYEVKFQQSLFPTDTSFDQTLFMTTPLIGEELKQIDKSHGRYLNHWVSGPNHITV